MRSYYRFGKPSERSTVRRIVDEIPNDGCILVFNANHANWRARVHEMYGKFLSVHVVDDKELQPIRDLYITWRNA
jgi:hypothetical protein